MSAVYNRLIFKTRLEAQWAAFFDLAGWIWRYNPIAIGNWQPTFRITFPCDHHVCGGSHTLLVAVHPADNIERILGYESFGYGFKDEAGTHCEDAGAVFGDGPQNTFWEMSHGTGGGAEDVLNWEENAEQIWAQAARLIK